MYFVYKLLGLEPERQFAPPWLMDDNGIQRKFDFKEGNIIVEMDGGLGHGEKVHSKSKITKEQSLKIDKWKDYQGTLHNYKIYRVDSKISNMDYLRNNIIKTLGNVYDLNNINWLLCEEFALKNIVKSTCELYEENKPTTASNLAKLSNMDLSTTCRYLRIGEKHGWCNFDKQYSRKEGLKNQMNNIWMKSAIPIEVYNSGAYIRTYTSASEIDKLSICDFGVKLWSASIIKAVNSSKNYKGYTFKRAIAS